MRLTDGLPNGSAAVVAAVNMNDMNVNAVFFNEYLSKIPGRFTGNSWIGWVMTIDDGK